MVNIWIGRLNDLSNHRLFGWLTRNWRRQVSLGRLPHSEPSTWLILERPLQPSCLFTVDESENRSPFDLSVSFSLIQLPSIFWSIRLFAEESTRRVSPYFASPQVVTFACSYHSQERLIGSSLFLRCFIAFYLPFWDLFETHGSGLGNNSPSKNTYPRRLHAQICHPSEICR